MGQRADAFDDAADLEEGIEAIESIVADVEAADEQVGELTATIPELRSALEDAHAEADGDADEDETTEDEG